MDTDPFDRLTKAELDVLRMLARGHTAKSIAQRLHVTVGSVNERLREARRKTGATSSRGLARAVVAPENCDDEIGVGKAGEVAQPSVARPTRGRVFMIGAGLMLIVLFSSLLWSVAQAPEIGVPQPAVSNDAITDDDPILKGAFNDVSPKDLYERLRRERREDGWASSREELLRVSFGQVLARYGLRAFRVRCASTVCEVAIPRFYAGSAASTNRMMRELTELQSKPAIRQSDLIQQATLFGDFAAFFFMRRETALTAPAAKRDVH